MNAKFDIKTTAWYIRTTSMIATKSSSPTTPARQATMNGLAVAGFVALIALGLFSAAYIGRFAPDVVNGIGSAAVYLGSVFTPTSDSSPLVTPTASTTISFGTDVPAATSTASPPPAARPAPR